MSIDLSSLTWRQFPPQPVEVSSSSLTRASRASLYPSEWYAASELVQTTTEANNATRSPGPSTCFGRNPTSSQLAPRHLPQPVERACGSYGHVRLQPAVSVMRNLMSQKPYPAAKSLETTVKGKFLAQPRDMAIRTSLLVLPSAPLCEFQALRAASKPSAQIPPQIGEIVVRTKSRKSLGDSTATWLTASNWNGASKPKEIVASHLQPGFPSPPYRPRHYPPVIETAKRSIHNDSLPKIAMTVDNVALEPQEEFGYSGSSRSPATAWSDNDQFDPPDLESRFSYASLVQRYQQKKPSFRVPTPSIPSSSSGDFVSSTVSLSTSPSTLSDESTQLRQTENQFREDFDERFSGHLELAPRSAEGHLKDQALAAFPNEQDHQTVSHFAGGEGDTYDERDTSKITLEDMRADIGSLKHETVTDLERELEEMRTQKKSEMRIRENMVRHRDTKFSASVAARRLANSDESADNNINNILGGWQTGRGLSQMTHAASPMLGGDLVFPRSLSPDSTMCDMNQASVHLETNREAPRKCEGCLWAADICVGKPDEGGLWMGMCKKAGDKNQATIKVSKPAAIVREIGAENRSFQNPGAFATPGSEHRLPSVPSILVPGLDRMDRTLALEQEIDHEFHDGFVTQVYNYLSLGYPSLARDFDEELSKISCIPIEELRQDDQLADAKGYVGAPESSSVNEGGVTKIKCTRWTALKLYIREWARQQLKTTGSESRFDAWVNGAQRS